MENLPGNQETLEKLQDLQEQFEAVFNVTKKNFEEERYADDKALTNTKSSNYTVITSGDELKLNHNLTLKPYVVLVRESNESEVVKENTKNEQGRAKRFRAVLGFYMAQYKEITGRIHELQSKL
ncbi:hypothetical protein QAD02_015606 [Eretmocerus hayati]|uniref:Uncharacterized protein n=1 Tax=Eretmocerus hayati TaxID=131215 RepID=A0ACC2PB56_9HYME|nr:hypothetical protein QAD02_015606 [Eretmocerus hayati]